ncbi:MAG: potassium transporter KtrB, partial [bacterium]|nr:potassium transporter KtrB [bacterium]
SIIWARLNMQTRVVLLATVILDLTGMLLFLFFEYDGVLAELGIMEKIGAALFQSVSSRTAGFNVVPIATMAPATVLFLLVWMFIGASPGSTGGGIKTTTLAVALMSVRAMLTGRDEVELMGRRIPSVIVNRSLSIILISGVVIIFFLMWMVGTQNLPFERLLFEVVSAFGTVGLSMDMTTKLDNFGRILVILLMFVGRIGPMTMALAIGERSRPKGYRLAEGRLAVG